VRHFGEPFGDSSAVPAFYAARLARRAVKVVLSGDGGDELFAGYDHHRAWLRWLSPGLGRRLAGALLPQAYPPPRADVQGWLRVVAATSARERRQLWRAELRPHGVAIPAAHASALAGGIPRHPLTLAQTLDLQVYLPGDLLAKVDITAMMHGLEVRTPFADLRMAEFAATIPPELQAGIIDGVWQGKLVLRRALLRRYPAGLLARRKRGFAVPLARWFAPGGPLHGALHERLLDAHGPLGALFQPRAVQALVRARRHGPLWLLLVLDEWLRQHPGVAA
jgi:asparagine synthase (glutamine-hydrolysing)